MRSRPRRAPSPRRLKGRTSFLVFPPRGRLISRWLARWPTHRLFSRWPTPIPRSPPKKSELSAPTRLSRPGDPTIPTKSIIVLGFPYIFRGALDVRASTINDAMKIAAAEALAELAREDVPDEVAAAYSGQRLQYGRDYIVPTPFDPRLIWAVPTAVATAAMDSGVARKPITN